MLPAFLFLGLLAGSYNIATVAGSDWVGENIPATSAILLQSQGIAADNSGNIYVSDAANHRVRCIAPNGIIRTIAGNGVAGFTGDGGPASSAQLNSPYGLAFDFAGNLYIADLGNARLRRITPAGIISTIAGGGSLPAGGKNEGSMATMLSLNAPRNVAVDGNGVVYFSDFAAHRVYQMTTDGTLTTLAGTGFAGYSSDGPAAGAPLNYPTGIAVDRQSNVYIADSGNHLIRKISAGRMVSIARANLPTGLAYDGFSTLCVADRSAAQILEIPLNGGAAAAMNVSASDVVYGNDGNLYAADTTVTRRVNMFGASQVIAGGGSLAEGDGGPALQARLNHPTGIALDTLGNLYIADHDNNRIRRVGLDGTIYTIAGTGTSGNTGDGGPATQATLNGPTALTFDPMGNLYIADTGNARIRRLTPGGVIQAVATGPLSAPACMIFDSLQNLYIADATAIFKVTPAGATTPVLSGLTSPRGLALDASGNLFFSEPKLKQVWMLAASGTHTQLAPGLWNSPQGITIDANGNLLVADSGLAQVLNVNSLGQVTPVAGTGSAGFAGDGGSSLLAQLSAPSDIAGSFVADTGNNRIRQLTGSANQTSVAPIIVISVVNAASLTPGPVAPGMLIALIGTGLTSADAPQTQVLFNSVPAPILSITPTQVLVRAPLTLAGTVQITVTNQGAQMAQIVANVVEAAPALFANTNSQVSAINQDGTLNSTSNPAARGSIIALFGTGEGVTGLPFSLSIGGYSATILYAGPSGNYPGMFQINAQVPSGYFSGGTLPIVVSVGTYSTQSDLTITIF